MQSNRYLQHGLGAAKPTLKMPLDFRKYPDERMAAFGKHLGEQERRINSLGVRDRPTPLRFFERIDQTREKKPSQEQSDFSVAPMLRGAALRQDRPNFVRQYRAQL